eukprot:scaffold14850_cov53-Phaeocystis_antarctica.AAC.1
MCIRDSVAAGAAAAAADGATPAGDATSPQHQRSTPLASSLADKAGGALATPTRSGLRSGAPPTGGGGARSGARRAEVAAARWATSAARWPLSCISPKTRTLPTAMASRSSVL